MSLFETISSLKTEDISTELLAFMLSSEDKFTPFKKIFLKKIFNDYDLIENLTLNVDTQKEYNRNRPDLTIETLDKFVILENKLISNLSSPDQLLRYLSIFKGKTFSIYNYKYLIFLCPRHILNSELIKTDKLCRKKYGKTFKKFCLVNNVTFKSLTWEEIISNLDLGENIQNEIFEYITLFCQEVVSVKEIEAIKNKETATGLKKVYSQVYKMSSQVNVDGYQKKGRVM